MNNKRYASSQETNSFFKGFLNALCILIDEESQKKAWINDDYSSYHLDYSDVYEAVISPLETIITWESLPADHLKELKILYNMIYNYNDTKTVEDKRVPKTNKEIAQDPEWHQIRLIAKRVYEAISNYIPT
ncbi:MAG: hypothetical protein H7A38_02470 [Chlamydiales bacterium]|nr:hypothetical protein [Chlamydiales bacterium]